VGIKWSIGLEIYGVQMLQEDFDWEHGRWLSELLVLGTTMTTTTSNLSILFLKEIKEIKYINNE
jgi:hypothetical protein